MIIVPYFIGTLLWLLTIAYCFYKRITFEPYGLLPELRYAMILIFGEITTLIYLLYLLCILSYKKKWILVWMVLGILVTTFFAFWRYSPLGLMGV